MPLGHAYPSPTGASLVAEPAMMFCRPICRHTTDYETVQDSTTDTKPPSRFELWNTSSDITRQGKATAAELQNQWSGVRILPLLPKIDTILGPWLDPGTFSFGFC